MPISFRFVSQTMADTIYFDPMDHWENTLDHNLVTKNRRKKLYELIANLKPLPGIEDWICTANALRMHLTIASASPRYWVLGHLERMNLLKYFELIITRDDVKELKQNLEVFQIVLEKFQLFQKEVLAIEDSPVGASAALTAGLQCIVILIQSPPVLFFLLLVSS